MYKIIALTLILLSAAGCGSGGGDAASGDPEAASSSISLADTHLKSGDVDAAKIEYETAMVADPNSVAANFGIGLINLAQLGEGSVGTAILAKFGQPSLRTSLVLGPTGFLAQLDQLHQECKLEEPSVSSLPFGFLSPLNGSKNKKARRILTNANPDLTSADVQKALVDIMPVVKNTISQWVIAAKDPNFSFTIPKELFYSNNDVVVQHADLGLGIAGLYGFLAAVDIANSWSVDINLGELVDEFGNLLVPKADLVATLNTFFVLKKDNNLDDAKANLLTALQRSKDVLEELLKGNDGGALVVNDGNKAGGQELLTMVEETLTSFDTTTAISTTSPLVNLNIGNVFANPPDASSIDIDPFVLEGTKIKAVESFFQEMLDQTGGIDVKISQKIFKIFTAAVKDKSFRKSLFGVYADMFKDPKCK